MYNKLFQIPFLIKTWSNLWQKKLLQNFAFFSFKRQVSNWNLKFEEKQKKVLDVTSFYNLRNSAQN